MVDGCKYKISTRSKLTWVQERSVTSNNGGCMMNDWLCLFSRRNIFTSRQQRSTGMASSTAYINTGGKTEQRVIIVRDNNRKGQSSAKLDISNGWWGVPHDEEEQIV